MSIEAGPLDVTAPEEEDAPDASAKHAEIGRYVFRRLVGSGGMGVVIAAHDPELDREVAIKLIVADRDAEGAPVREARAMARLSHPNVVSVYEVLRLADRSAIVMELVDGQDLGAWRKSQKPGWRAIVEAYVQASRGLAAAHRAGLVHRDFKPSNALIDRDGLVRVTDFGLARTDEATDATSRTQSGTPAYMAPEQHRGEAVDARADQWALACSLYGALHDQQPFAGKDRAELAAAVTRGVVEPEPAGTPVPRHIRSAIRRALSPDPGERFASMDDLVRALSPVEPGGGGERGPRRRLARVALAAAGVVAVLALGIGAERGCQARRDGAAFASTAHPLVVVSEFRTRRGDPRVAATFAELLSAQLRVGDALRTPAPDARSAMLEAGGLRGASVVATASFFSRLRAATGADVLVSGELDTTGSTLRAELQLHDAARGTRVGTVTLSGPANDLHALVREAGARVRRGLARPAVSMEDGAALRSILPDTPDASLAYVDGLAARRVFRHRDAVAHFEKAIALAPTFAPAYSALAQAHLSLGHQQAAREAAERAVRLASSLPRGEELLVQALAAETRHDWPGAIESYRALAQFYPDRIDYVTSLARALVGAGKAAEAITLLDTTKKRPQSDWDLVSLDLLAAFAHARRSDDAASLAAAERAEQLAAKIGARVAMADAILAQAHRHHRAGRLDDAEAHFGTARAVYADVGDEDNLLNCDAALAEIASVRGDYAKAIAIGERIVEAHRATGNLYRLARVTVALGIFHASAGHLANARDLCDEGGRIFEQARDREGEAFRLLNIAELDFRMGRLAGVVDELTRGRAIHAEIGQRAGVAEADAALARVAWLQGRVTEADAAFEVAATEAAGAGESGLRAEIALDRARLAFARAAPAEKARFDEATALVAASSDARLLALLDVHAGRRALAGGDREEGRRRAKSAAESARKAHAPDAIALSLAILLDTLAPDPPRGTARRADTGDGDASPAARESLRVELASRAEALEDLEPQIECLLALSRAARGADAVALADRALRLARDHGLLALDPAARRAVTHAHAHAGP